MSVVNISADGAVAATPSDTVNDVAGPFNSLIVWAAGTVAFVDEMGHTIAASGALAAGTEIRVKAIRVMSTGTTATVLGTKAVM